MVWNKYRGRVPGARESALEMQKEALTQQRDHYKVRFEDEREENKHLREKLIALRKSIPREVEVTNGPDLVLGKALRDPKVYQDDNGWLHVDHAGGEFCFKEWTAYDVENPE